MDIDNQIDYWDKVASQKIFTHPLEFQLLEMLLDKQSSILDFGCGYGRIVRQLMDAGYMHVVGYDTSKELIIRGKSDNDLTIFHISKPTDLPLENCSVDCIILFAVLTCIPSNNGQEELISLLYSKLKKGGIVYISDYYLQDQSTEIDRYDYLNNDPENYGVFKLPEGATFRHHTVEWIAALTKDFHILYHAPVQLVTMNGQAATGFQFIGRK